MNPKQQQNENSRQCILYKTRYLFGPDCLHFAIVSGIGYFALHDTSACIVSTCANIGILGILCAVRYFLQKNTLLCIVFKNGAAPFRAFVIAPSILYNPRYFHCRNNNKPEYLTSQSIPHSMPYVAKYSPPQIITGREHFALYSITPNNQYNPRRTAGPQLSHRRYTYK